MRYWLDTEFIEDGRTIDLVSIGVVREDGTEYYAEVLGADLERASPWFMANVLPHLRGGAWRINRADIRADLLRLIDPALGKPEIWGYYADYDWVALCQVFGTMRDLPPGWPMYARDVKQLAVSLGDPRLPAEGKDEHHALADARWNKQAWEFLMSIQKEAR